MHALAISTYMIDPVFNGRLEVFKRSLTSLKESRYSGKIFLVDDASPYKGHIDFARSLEIPNLTIIEKTVNGGISKNKNTCIRLILESGATIGLLADDDLLYSRDFAQVYVNAMNASGIHHMSYFIFNDERRQMAIHNGVYVDGTNHVNGCFLTFTRALIEKIGYFKILPYKYGHEHSNFTLRAVHNGMSPFFCDVRNSHSFIKLIDESVGHSAITIDMDGFRENEQIIREGLHLPEPCIE